MGGLFRWVVVVSLLFGCVSAWPAEPARTLRHGARNAITDVKGIRVGHYTRNEPPYLTGTTVVWAPEGAVASTYVGGGWPGTINTDVLDPAKNAQKLDAAFLTGGSYYGLAAFAGVMSWLEEHGYGLQVGPDAKQLDPLVAGAVVFDLNRGGRFQARPTAEFGYGAMNVAATGPVEQGNVGAGTGTTTHGGFPLKGGVGTASVVVGKVTLGAIVAVNAAGSPVDLSDCSLRGARNVVGDEFKNYRTPSAKDCAAAKEFIRLHPDERPPSLSRPPKPRPVDEHPNTTIGVVATDAILSKEQARELARAANEGLAWGLDVINTMGDGDSFFALSTGQVEASPEEFAAILSATRELVGRAIAHAAFSAKSVGPFRSYCDSLPSACKK
jgi:L-aminopeptidase/D-esterase-like protein